MLKTCQRYSSIFKRNVRTHLWRSILVKRNAAFAKLHHHVRHIIKIKIFLNAWTGFLYVEDTNWLLITHLQLYEIFGLLMPNHGLYHLYRVIEQLGGLEVECSSVLLSSNCLVETLVFMNKTSVPTTNNYPSFIDSSAKRKSGAWHQMSAATDRYTRCCSHHPLTVNRNLPWKLKKT